MQSGIEPTSRPERPDFVDALVADLRAVPAALPLRHALGVWLGLGVVSTTAAILLFGPLRDHVLADLATPRLALEILLGTGALATLAIAALESGVPGGPSRARLLLPPLLLAAAWLAVAVGAVPLDGPAPSMLGKREHCFLEGLAITLFPALLGLQMIRGRSLRGGVLTGSLIGLAAGLLPALGMQLACMYESQHALHYHFTPMLVGAAVAGALGGLLQSRD